MMETHFFVPISSRGLMQPPKRGAQQPRAQTHSAGCRSAALPDMVLGGGPL